MTQRLASGARGGVHGFESAVEMQCPAPQPCRLLAPLIRAEIQAKQVMKVTTCEKRHNNQSLVVGVVVRLHCAPAGAAAADGPPARLLSGIHRQDAFDALLEVHQTHARQLADQPAAGGRPASRCCNGGTATLAAAAATAVSLLLLLRLLCRRWRHRGHCPLAGWAWAVTIVLRTRPRATGSWLCSTTSGRANRDPRPRGGGHGFRRQQRLRRWREVVVLRCALLASCCRCWNGSSICATATTSTSSATLAAVTGRRDSRGNNGGCRGAAASISACSSRNCEAARDHGPGTRG